MLKRWLAFIYVIIVVLLFGIMLVLLSKLNISVKTVHIGIILGFCAATLAIPAIFVIVAKRPLTHLLITICAAPYDQKRILAFGSILLHMNGESSKMVKLLYSSKRQSKEKLDPWWGITDHDVAKEVAVRLSTGTNHTGFSDDIFKVFVKRGVLPPIDSEDWAKIKNGAEIENAYNRVLSRFYGGQSNIPDKISLEEGEEVLETFFDTIDSSLESYLIAEDLLLNLGYSKEELLGINTLAAYDYGRTAFVARNSLNAGYLSADEAWECMEIAANNASKTYLGWREYFAAFIIGRAIGFGASYNDDYYDPLNYLLNNDHSPLNSNSFR